ncbi:MAG: hypothetical protein ACYS4W_09865 [Planctomycetota bacterium]|jgi:hypothetical protein
MGGWRSKIIFLLVIYFAGFATAIYCLAPVPENRGNHDDAKTFVCSVFKSDEFAKSFNSGMHKCLDLAKDAAQRAGEFVKDFLAGGHGCRYSWPWVARPTATLLRLAKTPPTQRRVNLMWDAYVDKNQFFWNFLQEQFSWLNI